MSKRVFYILCLMSQNFNIKVKFRKQIHRNVYAMKTSYILILSYFIYGLITQL